MKFFFFLYFCAKISFDQHVTFLGILHYREQRRQEVCKLSGRFHKFLGSLILFEFTTNYHHDILFFMPYRLTWCKLSRSSFKWLRKPCGAISRKTQASTSRKFFKHWLAKIRLFPETYSKAVLQAIVGED